MSDSFKDEVRLHITERIQWVIDACTIDRDAKHELECVIEAVQSLLTTHPEEQSR